MDSLIQRSVNRIREQARRLIGIRHEVCSNPVDTGLLYGFYPSGFLHDWELVWSFGYNLTILEGGQYRGRNAFAFNEEPDLSSVDLENYVGVETAPWGSFESLTFETVGNLAVAPGYRVAH